MFGSIEEWKNLEEQIRTYDNLRSRTKEWCITFWLILNVYGLQQQIPIIFLLSIFIIVFFWTVEARYAYYQRICYARVEFIEAHFFIKRNGIDIMRLIKKFNEINRDKRDRGCYSEKLIKDKQSYPATSYHFTHFWGNEKIKKQAMFGKNIMITYVPLIYISFSMTVILGFISGILDQMTVIILCTIGGVAIILLYILYCKYHYQRKDHLIDLILKMNEKFS